MSALRVEIPTTADAEKSAQPDDLEIAAAIVAVMAFSSATDNLADSDESEALTGNAWRKASFSEGTGGARVTTPQTHCKLSPWQASTFFKACLSLPLACLSIMLMSAQAKAQELRPLSGSQSVYSSDIASTSNGATTYRRTTTISIPVAPRSNVYSAPANSDASELEDPDEESATPNPTEQFATTNSARTNISVPQSGYSRMVNAPSSAQAAFPNTNKVNQAFIGKKTVIKIGLAFGNSRIDVAAIDGAQVRDAVTGVLVANLRPNSRWDIALVNNGRFSQLALSVKAQSDNQLHANNTTYGESSKYKNVAYYPGASANSIVNARLPLRFSDADLDGTVDANASSAGYIISPRPDDANAVVSFNGKLYRGSLWLKPLPKPVGGGQFKAAAFDVINLLDVEDYLLSVVPSEMPSGWPLEALKAQAVAARSYAVANLGKHGRDGYDLKATIDDQVYSGISSESDTSNQAVVETSGLVLKHEGRAITAFFHSTSGGSTEVSERVWGKPLGYLQSVPDYDDASPHFTWAKRFAADDLERMVGADVGRLLSISVVTRSRSNRAQDLMVQGSNGSKVVTGESLRRSLKLPSTLFNVGNDGNGYIFAGRGYGHGLGMSQYGAKALAERGCNAAQILSYYYKDVVVDYAVPTPGI
ncbi:MAG TPA: SpoIID/LytB domain-containing protein [Oculatellaceae cyanobacterium]